MTRQNVQKQELVFPYFSPDSDDRLSLNFHRFVILYRSCDTRSVGLGKYCLPRVYNGFKIQTPVNRTETLPNKLFHSSPFTLIFYLVYRLTGCCVFPIAVFYPCKYLNIYFVAFVKWKSLDEKLLYHTPKNIYMHVNKYSHKL